MILVWWQKIRFYPHLIAIVYMPYNLIQRQFLLQNQNLYWVVFILLEFPSSSGKPLKSIKSELNYFNPRRVSFNRDRSLNPRGFYIQHISEYFNKANSSGYSMTILDTQFNFHFIFKIDLILECSVPQWNSKTWTQIKYQSHSINVNSVSFERCLSNSVTISNDSKVSML